MQFQKCLFFFVFIILNASCNFTFYNKSQPEDGYPIVLRRNTNKEIIIDGKKDRIWRKGKSLVKLISPWENVLYFEDATTFKASYDENYLYFSFEVQDANIHLANEHVLDESNVLSSDRVEVFFASANKSYYSFEMDASGRLFDSKAKFGSSINASWNIPKSVFKIAATRDKKSYFVEAKLKMSWLIKKGLIMDDNTIRVGIFRADYNQDGSEARWLSWKRPDGDVPDFHQVSAFGKMMIKL